MSSIRLRRVVSAANQDADYVTIEIGANDACRPTIEEQTSTETFRQQVHDALDALVNGNENVTGNPNVYIEMLSIPNINQLYTIFTSPVVDPNAILRWSPGVLSQSGTCQALLLNAPSDAQVDVERRAAFRAQVIAYNGALADVCAEFKRCLFDNNAVFNSSFTAADVATVTNTAALPGIGSPADYFHPSLQGQATLAEGSWTATFSFD